MTVRVLYVAGTGRSGSTLLARILGRVDGVLAAGELRYVWQRGLLEDRLCGCGEAFSRCPFWSEVVDRAFGGRRGVDAAGVAAAQRAVTRLRHVPAMLARHRPSAPGHLLETLGRLYRAVADASGCDLVVEGLDLPPWEFAFQSASTTGEPWLGPDLLAAIERSGARRVLVCPIGFVADHLEILYDLDVEAQAFASERGLEIRRTASFNDRPEFIAALADIVRDRL